KEGIGRIDIYKTISSNNTTPDSKYHINKYLSKRPIGVPKNLYLHIGMKLIFGHKNIQGIHAYKEVNKTQNLATMNTLTHAIKPTRSLILIDSTRNM
ncbi:10100_t:CDS:2, partial [Entrophospora sp. SA101]